MKKVLFLVTALLCAVACSNDESNDDQVTGTSFSKGQVVTISAGARQSRVAGAGNGDAVDFTWETGDRILVKVGGASATFTLSSGAGTSAATFTGTMPADGSTFDIQYPVTDPDLSIQTYMSGKVPAGKMSFSASGCTLDTPASLSPVTAVLRLKFYGAGRTISKIVVTNTASSASYTLNISPAVTLPTTETDAAPFFLVLPAGEYKVGVEVFDNASPAASISKFTTSNEQDFGDFSVANYVYMPAREIPNYFCFTAMSAGATVKMDDDIQLEYSIDGSNFSEWTESGSNAITLSNVGDKLYLRTMYRQNTVGTCFITTGDLKVSGNIMSLLNGSNPTAAKIGDYCFVELFKVGSINS